MALLLSLFLLRFNIFSRTLFFHQILTNIPSSMASTIFLSISRFISIFASVLFCKQSLKNRHQDILRLGAHAYVLAAMTVAVTSRLQRSQLLHGSHKANVSLTHGYLPEVKWQNFRISVFTSQLSNIDNVSVSMLYYARLRLQQQILSPKPIHNYFVTPQCITDSRSQRLQLPRDLHKAKCHWRTPILPLSQVQDSSKQANPMSSSIPIHIYLTTSINIRLTHGSRTSVANTRFHKKARLIRKAVRKCLLASLSNPIQ